MRTFLSLQAVQSRLPLRLQLTLKITSGCVSSRLIMASPLPTFQMMIWLSQPKMDTQHTHTTKLCLTLFSELYIAQCNATENKIMAQIWGSRVHSGQVMLQCGIIILAWSCMRVYETLQPKVTCTEKNIASSWVPRHNADSLRVAL